MADDVDQLLAPQRVEHDRAVRPQPLPVVGRQRRAPHGGGRDDRPVADLAGEPGRVRPEQRRPDRRVDAVGADDHVGLGRAAVRERRDGRVPRRRNRHAPRAEGHHARRHRRREHVEQVGPVRGRSLDPLQRPLLTAAGPADQPAGHPVPGDRPLRPPRDLPHAVLDPDRAQHPHRVGVQRDPGPDFSQLGRRLVHPDLDPRPRQRDRRREPADAAADDRHPCHAAILPPPGRLLNRRAPQKSPVKITCFLSNGPWFHLRPPAATCTLAAPTPVRRPLSTNYLSL